MQALQTKSPLTRGLTPPPPRLPSEEEVAALTIAGQVVLVDLGNFELTGSEPAAVIRFDGSVGIEYARYANRKYFFGERGGLYDVVPTEGRASESHGCMILGRVISRE